MQIYKAHVLFTPDRTRFEVIENGYLAVDEGKVVSINLFDSVNNSKPLDPELVRLASVLV